MPLIPAKGRKFSELEVNLVYTGPSTHSETPLKEKKLKKAILF